MRKIALLLALMMILSVFVSACSKSDDANGDITSALDEASKETSNESNSESNKDNTNKETVFTGVSVAENPSETIISNGASYTTSAPADAAYEDTYGTELTDGIRCEVVDGTYTDVSLSGYDNNINVTIDLGAVNDRIYGFRVGYLCYDQAAIAEPSRISARVSLDGKKWSTAGALVKAVPPEDDPNAFIGTVKEANYVAPFYFRARYVQFTISRTSAWQFLDEVMVIADIDDAEKNSAYNDAINKAYQTLGSVKKPTSDVAINRDLDKLLISKGSKYTIDGTVKRFQDVGNKMLTDGKISGYYEGNTWVGFDASSDVKITVDLGITVNDIACVEANFYTNVAVGTYLPVAVKITAIDKEKNRTDLGILYGNAVVKAGAYCFSLPLDTAISARYIEYTFVATETNCFMLEELGVYAYRETEESSLYPAIVLKDDASEWGSEGDNEYTNLVLGKTQQILASSAVLEEQMDNHHNTPVTSTLMTNGKFAIGTDIHNGSYFKFCTGAGRTVIYDLDHISSVDKFTASFVDQKSWSVLKPNKVAVYTSVDGNNWYAVGEVSLAPDVDPSDDSAICRGELKLEKAVKARYVAYEFDVSTWSGCDELEVFGRKNSSGGDAATMGYELRKGFLSGTRIKPSEELLGGSKDLCLMYHDKNNYYEAEDFIPYLAYVDKEGNPQDLMFDSFLFLHTTGSMPSGASCHNGSVISDWNWTLTDLFMDGRNVMALEDAAGQVKTALNLAGDYKFKFAVTLYYPYKFNNNGSPIAYDFGDVDGDGVAENTGKLEDRIKIIEWYINSVEKLVKEKNFNNIELVGYYWWHEALESADKDSTALLNATSDLVHGVDKNFFWIPYYCSPGYNQWADVGFDVACMQPNYVFRADAPYSNVVNCAEITQLLGMGFEMEVDGTSLSQLMFYKKYMEYLSSGAKLGYMNDTIVMYYQGVSIFGDAAKSEFAMARNVYDQTYHFIKGDLLISPEVIKGLNCVADKNTPVVGTIDFDNDIPREFRIESMPEHGTVSMNGDGTFTFYPEKDFTGEVVFSFSYNECLGWSAPCEVVVTVK